jgi:hypothetical protein
MEARLDAGNRGARDGEKVDGNVGDEEVTTPTVSRARRRRLLAIAALVGILGAPSAARAQAVDAALAESLFREGKALMDKNRLAEACPKLAESQRLDPGSGTMLALALCHERQGKHATAWAAYNEAATMARAAGRADRQEAATQRAAALEGKLSRLVVSVDPAARAAPGLSVRRDGAPLPDAAWGVSIPVDPGEHLIEASAPGKEPWSVRVTLGATRDHQRVVVPALADQRSTGGDGVDKPRRIAAFVVGGAGVAALGVGAVFGAMAISKRSRAEDLCGGASPCASANGVASNDQAKTFALVSNITLGAGVAAAGTGLFLLLTSRTKTAAPLPVGVRVSRHEAGLVIDQTW